MNLKSMKSRFIVNPFFWFTLVWTMILMIHSLDIMTIYPSTPPSLFAFMIFILVLSIIFGLYYQHRFLAQKTQIVLDNDKPNWAWIILCLIGFILEVRYSKMIPILEVFRGNTSSYQQFGIPHVTFVLVSMTIALNAVASVKFFYGSQHKIIHALTIAMCMMIFLLSYSRGILIFTFLITLAIFLTKIRFSVSTILFLLFLGLVGALLFNAAGNIRQNDAYNDSHYIMDLAGFRNEYRVLAPFSWVLTYIDTPLGNLCYNFVYVSPENNATGLISQLIPDFISKRLFPEYDSALFLIQPGLTASSMFAGGYKYFGLLGMFLSYMELCIFIFICAFITRNNTKVFLATTSGLCIMTAMTFFDNMVTYSGYSFFLIFLIGYRFFTHNDEEYVRSQKDLDFIVRHIDEIEGLIYD